MNTAWVKQLEPLGYPLGLFWLLLVASGLVFLLKRRWGAALWLWLLAAFLSLFGASNLSYRLLASLERPQAAAQPANWPAADAVVMLGGTLDPSPHDLFGLRLSDAGERAVAAAEIIRQKKAPVLVLGGGGAQPNNNEALLLQKWLGAWGLLPPEVIALPPSTNTHDEALHVRDLARTKGWKKILLVTSAYHMKRAAALFRTVGIDVIPAPCDFIGLSKLAAGPALLVAPVSERLEAAQLFCHEKLGWWYYRWRGWIQ